MKSSKKREKKVSLFLHPPHRILLIASFLSFFSPLILCREKVHPHYHASEWRNALVHLETRVLAQGGGTRCRGGDSGRHGRDRLYQTRFSRGRCETWTRARTPRRARLGTGAIAERRRGGSGSKEDRKVLRRVACWTCQATVDIPHR
jgi:hypothetical protein